MPKINLLISLQSGIFSQNSPYLFILCYFSRNTIIKERQLFSISLYSIFYVNFSKKLKYSPQPPQIKNHVNKMR